jgi:hypothetical protein
MVVVMAATKVVNFWEATRPPEILTVQVLIPIAERPVLPMENLLSAVSTGTAIQFRANVRPMAIAATIAMSVRQTLAMVVIATA